MRKIVLGFMILLAVISCGNVEENYEAIENALISVIEGKNEKQILKKLDKAMETSEEEAFVLTYLYFGNEKKDIFDKYLGKSDGNAEYYKALLLKNSGAPLDEVKKLLERAEGQGNKKAYYVLGSIHESNLEYAKAQEYYEKGKDLGEINATSAYYYNENFRGEQKKIERLKAKLLKNTISEKEKKELGKILVEKFANYEVAYRILREFLAEEYEPALYAKAKLLESENNINGALKIYKDLYFVHNYYMSAFEIARNLAEKEGNYKLALEVLEGANDEIGEIDRYRGYLYEQMKDGAKAQKYYQRAVKKKNLDAINSLGRIYEEENKIKKAKDIYRKGYKLGSVNAGYRLAMLLEKGGKAKKQSLNYNREARNILERLAESGDENAILELSKYYSKDSDEYRIINLRAAVKLNANALYNLAEYYKGKHKNKKTKIYYGISKKLGYNNKD